MRRRHSIILLNCGVSYYCGDELINMSARRQEPGRAYRRNTGSAMPADSVCHVLLFLKQIGELKYHEADRYGFAGRHTNRAGATGQHLAALHEEKLTRARHA